MLFTEIEIAERFVVKYAEALRFVRDQKCWYTWNGQRWAIDQTNFVFDLVRIHCREQSALCLSRSEKNLRKAISIASLRMVESIVRLVRVDRRISSTYPIL